jgi:hypothetical protein
VIAAVPPDRRVALVGGLAVSVRAEPRFTRDIDLAISAESDAQAEQIVFALQQRGFRVAAAIENTHAHRLSTIRLRQAPNAPFIDLLFSACGIEREIVDAAVPMSVLGSLVPVARTGHLIAMKLISRDAVRRPRDDQDLVELGRVAEPADWAIAAEAVTLIEQRGFARKRDLVAALAELRATPA